MKILITGGAGFIASNVADKYIELGHKVVIVDNLCTGFKENINPQAKFYEVDIRDQKKMAEIFQKERPEIVNHHAAQMDVRRSTREPIFDAENNIVASIGLIENCLKHKVKKIIYANTGGALYGEIPKKDRPVDENYPIRPICPYGISKHTVEHYLYAEHYNYDLKYTALRYPNVFGPRQNPHGEAGVVAIFCGLMAQGKQPTIFGSGEQTRDYTFVADIVRANVLALEKGGPKGYNVGTGREVSVNEIFEAIRQLLKLDMKPHYEPARVGEISGFSMRSDLAKKELGWGPKHSFEEGLALTLQWNKKKVSKK